MTGKGQKSAIGTIVERKSRYTCIVKLKDRKSAIVRKQFVKEFKAFDNQLTKTLTYDNGLEITLQGTITKQTGMPVYFAHP